MCSYKQFNTPCFIVDEADLLRNIQGFYQALHGRFSQAIIGYSVKTNALPYILKLALQQGCYAEVVSYHEYQLALHVGFPKQRIIYNGPMKSKETFVDALLNQAIVNIESWREIAWLRDLPVDRTYRVGIRVNINISSVSPEDQDHPEDDSRFGFSYESGELRQALDQIADLPYIKVVGIHSHREPKTRSVRFYSRVITYVQRIILEYHLSLEYWDLGGGFFGSMPNKPAYRDYVECFYQTLFPELRDLCFIVEPGNAVVASAFDYVMQVIDVKQHDHNIYISTDGTRNDVDPFFHKSTYFSQMEYHDDTAAEAPLPQVVGGLSCLEYDRIFTLPVGSRQLSIGDRIIFHRVGAYTMSLTPLFIHYFPTVYLKNVQAQV